MQDKLIEEMHAVYGREHDHQTGLGADRDLAEKCGLRAALAAVRAHDAGTDDGLRKALREKQDRAYCEFIRESGQAECLGWEQKVKNRTFGKAELDAHSHAGQLFGEHIGYADALKMISENALHDAESTAQLDAEDPAEPGEDVVDSHTTGHCASNDIEQLQVQLAGCLTAAEGWGTKADPYSYGWSPAYAAVISLRHQFEEATSALAEARKGYYSQQDVEKAIRAVWKEHYHSQAVWSKEEFLSKLMARLAPKPEPSQSAVIDTLRAEDFLRANVCIECGAIVVHQELHAKWHAALVDRRTK